MVEDVGGASDGVATKRGNLAKGRSGGLVEKRGIRAWPDIRLSRPRRMGCCIVLEGTIHVHAARAAVGRNPRRNCTLSRMEVEGVRGAEVRSRSMIEVPRVVRTGVWRRRNPLFFPPLPRR